VAALAGTDKLYRPSLSVEVPCLPFFTITVTPGIEVPSEPTTAPDTVRSCALRSCATRAKTTQKNNSKSFPIVIKMLC